MTEVLRERNRRGEGGRLRADILAGATELLEQTGSEEAVTLRAVARQVGHLSAVDLHPFPDREAIVDAIVDSAFADFNDAIDAAIEARLVRWRGCAPGAPLTCGSLPSGRTGTNCCSSAAT